MKAEEFKDITVKDQYGELVTIIEINDNIATAAKGAHNYYHVSNIFHKGKSVYNWLNEENN
jgi:acyl dehydratase